MKLKLLIYITAIGITMFLASCSDFGDLNENPNEPINVPTSGLITSAEASIEDLVGRYIQELYVQHMSEITYTEDSRYQTTRVDFTAWYTSALADLQRVIDLNTDPETAPTAAASGSNANQLAVARILKSYIMANLTDRWGPLPYTEALKGRENFTPAYDSQETIYTGILNELKEAATQINLGEKPVSGDFILNGNMEEWKLFANTLRANYAMRVADVAPDLGKQHFTEAYGSAGDKLITSSVLFPFIADQNYENPWFTRFRTREDYAIAKTLTDHMESTSDPRLVNFADPTQLSVSEGDPKIVGNEYGLTDPSTVANTVSFPNSTYVRAQTAPLPIITLAQVYFLEAEAIQRGWISGDAEESYKEGIKASMAQWGISLDEDAFNDYYNQDGVTWSSDNWKQVLGNQKWVSLYTQGLEAWAEWRRLDYPVLTPAAEPLNQAKVIPLRERYPTTEAELNEENYNAALQMLGGENSSGTRLWWDVN